MLQPKASPLRRLIQSLLESSGGNTRSNLAKNVVMCCCTPCHVHPLQQMARTLCQVVAPVAAASYPQLAAVKVCLRNWSSAYANQQLPQPASLLARGPAGTAQHTSSCMQFNC
jgi:hypothetical protein